MTRIRRVRYPKLPSRGWPAETLYLSWGRFPTPDGGSISLTGVGSTPAKAKLDMLYRLGRRRRRPE